MIRRTINNFLRGRNLDDSKAIISQDQYLEAHNLELVGDGVFNSLQNIKGTTNLKDIITDSSIKEIGAFAVKFLIEGESKRCNLYFTISSTLFKIWAYDIDGDTLYELYEEEVETQDRLIDAVNYPEGGVDYVYFTDFYKGLRFIKCEIPSPYIANYLTSFDISLQRKGSLGSIALSSIASGGSLLSGTYQFAYRMADPTNKRFTKWSSLTNPIHVYDAANSSAVIHAGIRLLTSRKITLSISPSTAETDNFDYLQLAVIENVGASAAGYTADNIFVPTASLLEIAAIPSTSLTFDYKANTRIGTIPLSDIVVDLAQIETIKTLKVKQNRLMGGNIKYTPLEFDNGTPSVTSGTIATRVDTNQDAYSSDEFSSKYLGYFRDEVYRFGVVYEDEDGNKSPAVALDLSMVTGNAATSGTDMKFPGRHVSNTYSLFNTSGYIKGLGLNLNGIVNHPTWAKKIHIVRLPRKKNILFQSPMIPMVDIYGIGAFDNYPTVYETGVQVTNTDAQPMTAGRILHPKNLFWPQMKCIRPLTSSTTIGVDTNKKKKGEALLQNQFSSNFAMMWPSAYTTEPYTFTGTEKMSVIDKALLRLDTFSDNPSKTTTVLSGDDANTNLSGNFYALNSGDYYFDPNWTAKSINSTEQNKPITESENFVNIGETASVAGVSAMDYDSMQTTGVTLGYKPSIQKSTVVQIGGDALRDISHYSISSTIPFANGTYRPYNGVGGGFVIGASGIKYEAIATVGNNYVTDTTYTPYISFSNRGIANACNIVNVTLGLGDDRYGDATSFHEYISTGATYTFSPSEVLDLEVNNSVSVDIEVWGGDCFIGPQTFKIADSAYSVTNQTTASQSAAQLISKWGLYFLNSFGRAMCLPVALENVGQYITVILESEYNGSVRDFDTLVERSPAVNGMPVVNNTSKEVIRTPLSYSYNINLSKQNSDKIYVTKPLYSFTQNEFPARVFWTDIKIYNSDQAGFDTIRAADFYDLEEQRYGITKLATAGDSLYAIQEKGVTFLPTGERQIEQTDADTLAVRSGDVIGRPIVIDSQRGSQHLRGIVETGNVIFLPDNINKSVYALSGTELQPITKDNETLFRTLFADPIDESEVIGFYDFIRNQYLLIAGGRTEIFDPKIGWVGDYEFTPTSGVFNEGLFVNGKVGSTLSVYSMYTGDVNQLFGVAVTPRVKVCINPEGEIAKTFDVLMLPATEALDEGDMVVEQDTARGNQTISGINFDVPSIENVFKMPVGRDSSKARARGMRALLTIKWKDIQSALSSLHTKYYPSKRTPF